MRGFYFNYDEARNIKKIKALTYMRKVNDRCDGYVEVCLTDMNADDWFYYRVDVAIVPMAKVERWGYIQKSVSEGSDSRSHVHACSQGVCQGEAAIMGFEFDKLSGWPNGDMRLDQIKVGVKTRADDVDAEVTFKDGNGGDQYKWKINYAVITT